MTINWSHPITVASIAAIPGICASVWALFAERRLRNNNERLARLTSQLERKKEGAIHIFKAKFDLELSAYKEIWESLWKARDRTLQLAPRVEYSSGTDDENEIRERKIKKHRAFTESYDTAVSAVLRHQPFYPKPIYTKVFEVLLACRKEGFRFRNGIDFTSSHNDDEKENRLAEIDRLYEEASELVKNRTDHLSIIDD